MFFSNWHINQFTDKTFYILGFFRGEFVEPIIKEKLNFIDGLNNGITLYGKVIKNVFLSSWDLYMNLDNFIPLVKVNLFLNIIIRIILIPICLVFVLILTVIAIPFYFFKLLFFKATISYYIGLIVSFLGYYFLASWTKEAKSNKYEENYNSIKES
jgi:hypothetical protein